MHDISLPLSLHSQLSKDGVLHKEFLKCLLLLLLLCVFYSLFPWKNDSSDNQNGSLSYLKLLKKTLELKRCEMMVPILPIET